MKTSFLFPSGRPKVALSPGSTYHQTQLSSECNLESNTWIDRIQADLFPAFLEQVKKKKSLKNFFDCIYLMGGTHMSRSEDIL